MRQTLTTPKDANQRKSISRVIFSIDRNSGRIISVVPTVDTDQELHQLEPWIEAALILSDLIQPRPEARAAA